MMRKLAWGWLLVAGLLLGHNAWLWFGQRIAPDTDILALLPVQERDPVLQRSFLQMVDAAQQRVVVLVGAADWQAAVRAAEAYHGVLRAHPELFDARTLSAGLEGDWLSLFQRHRLMLLTGEQVLQLRQQPAAHWQQTALAGMYGAFGGPKVGSWQDDPFGLFAGWVQQRAQETPVRPRDGHLFVSDGKLQYVLLPLTLKVPAFSLPAQHQVLPLLAQAAAAARAATPQADVIPAGVVLHAAAASRQAESEMSTIGIGSLAGIVLLAWLTFGTLRPILLLLLSLGIGCLGALSICWLLFGRIHLLTLVFGASLIGVAQDYGIYYLCQRQAAARGLASATLMRRLLPSLALTLLAAVIGYAGLALTPFPGLRAMALFSALGLVFAWLTVLCWFPLLVGGATLKQGRLAVWYGRSLQRWPRVPAGRGALLCVLLLAGLAIPGLLRLTANDDIRLLQNSPPQLVQDQIRLGQLLDAATPVQFFLVSGGSEQAVLQREEALKERLDGQIAAGRIRGYQSISNWVPSEQRQQQQRSLVAAKLLAVEGPLEEIAAAVGAQAGWSATVRARLLQAGTPLTVAAFMQSPASEPWRHLWLGRIEGQYASIVALRGMRYDGMAELRLAAHGLQGVQWVDKVGEISAVLARYRVNMAWVLAGAYGLVLLLLLPRYRARAWRVLAPVAVASIATLAALGWMSHSLQLFHVLALMLLLGVGVDYGIFMQERGAGRSTAPWLAVGLSAANTLLSFGLLGLSRTPALQAFGLTMLIGTALVWLLVPCFAMREEAYVQAD